jgi:hypothetical protein
MEEIKNNFSENNKIECLYCWFYSSVSVNFMNLEELNEVRQYQDLKPLKKLPKQNKEIF